MDLRELPEELRTLYEDAGMTAEHTENERIKFAMLGLQHAIQEDLERLRSSRETRTRGRITIRQIQL